MAGRGASASRRSKSGHFKDLVAKHLREVEALRQMDMYRAALKTKTVDTSGGIINNGPAGASTGGVSGTAAGDGGGSAPSSRATPCSTPMSKKRLTVGQNTFLQMLLAPPTKAASFLGDDDSSSSSSSSSAAANPPNGNTMTLSPQRKSAPSLPSSATTTPIRAPPSPSKRNLLALRMIDLLKKKDVVPTTPTGERKTNTKNDAHADGASKAQSMMMGSTTAAVAPPPLADDHDDDEEAQASRSIFKGHITFPAKASVSELVEMSGRGNGETILQPQQGETASPKARSHSLPDFAVPFHCSVHSSQFINDSKVDDEESKIKEMADVLNSNQPSENRKNTALTEQETPDNDDDNNDSDASGNKETPKVNVQGMNCLQIILLHLNNFRKACGAMVNNEHVQFGIIMLIVVNAIMMGIGTFDFVDNSYAVNRAFEISDSVFLIIFTVELAFQIIYRGLYIFLDGWLVFDFSIVVMSWSLENFQIVRAFRVFRAFRLVTRVVILKKLVLALFEVAPSMGAIIALLMLIIYIYAVLCTVLFQDLYEEGYLDVNYFGTLDASLFTLFQMMTLDWSYIARQVMVKDQYAWLIFGSFLILTSFILYSLIIAVVCDAVAVTEHSEETEAHTNEQLLNTERIAALQKRLHELGLAQDRILEAMNSALASLDDTDDSDDEHDLDESEQPKHSITEHIKRPGSMHSLRNLFR